jgi:hypothetical protein
MGIVYKEYQGRVHNRKMRMLAYLAPYMPRAGRGGGRRARGLLDSTADGSVGELDASSRDDPDASSLALGLSVNDVYLNAAGPHAANLVPVIVYWHISRHGVPSAFIVYLQRAAVPEPEPAQDVST